MRFRISAFLGIIVTAAGVACLAGALQAAPAPDAAHLFLQNCSMCHGRDGKGYAAIKTPNFIDPKWQASVKDKEMMEAIEHGRKGTAMPAFEGKLKPAEIRALIKYIRSLAPSKGK